MAVWDWTDETLKAPKWTFARISLSFAFDLHPHPQISCNVLTAFETSFSCVEFNFRPGGRDFDGVGGILGNTVCWMKSSISPCHTYFQHNPPQKAEFSPKHSHCVWNEVELRWLIALTCKPSQSSQPTANIFLSARCCSAHRWPISQSAHWENSHQSRWPVCHWPD